MRRSRSYSNRDRGNPQGRDSSYPVHGDGSIPLDKTLFGSDKGQTSKEKQVREGLSGKRGPDVSVGGISSHGGTLQRAAGEVENALNYNSQEVFNRLVEKEYINSRDLFLLTFF
jgi:hypothetical protein